jgi:hypothetical protein
MAKSVWSPIPSNGNLSGQVLSNEISGAQTLVDGQVKQLRDAAGKLFDAYTWCKDIPILNRALEQKLFEAILYTGLIGPIPVTIKASVALGLRFAVNAHINVEVSPFAKLLNNAQNYARSTFTLTSEVGIEIPCEIKADILFGIASVAARLIPEAIFQLDTQVGAYDDQPFARAFVSATIAVYFELKACLNFLLFDVCFSPGRVPLVPRRSLINGAPQDSLDPYGCPSPGAPPGGEGGAGAPAREEGKRGA